MRNRILNRWFRFGVVAALAAATVLLATPQPAAAAGTPGSVYALDVGRGVPGSIYRIGPNGGAPSRLALQPGPGVPDPPLINPVGITVDAQGFLIVAESDGYNSQHLSGTECVNGCGAILRVNPDTGRVDLISRGNLTSNPYSLLLPPDRDISDGVNDSIVVVDSGEGLVSVDPGGPVNNNQTWFPGPEQDPAGAPRPLSGPWDIARDIGKRNGGDLLVTNYGTGPDFVNELACPGQPKNGYILRLTPGGLFKGTHCDPRVLRPRGIATAADGSAFVIDPFAGNGESSSFGGLFRIPARGGIEYFSAGEPFQTPSGLDFSLNGKRLLVADEVAFTSGEACYADPGGCRGGVIQVNPDGGFLSQFSILAADPIDVAVDRRGGKLPLKPKKKKKKKIVRNLNNFNDDKLVLPDGAVGNPPKGFNKFPVVALRKGTRVRLSCLSKDCPRGETPKKRTAKGQSVMFVFDGLLKGKFRVTTYARARKGARVAYRGVYRDYTTSFQDGNIVVDSSQPRCLKPGAKQVSKKTRVKCPK